MYLTIKSFKEVSKIQSSEKKIPAEGRNEDETDICKIVFLAGHFQHVRKLNGFKRND